MPKGMKIVDWTPENEAKLFQTIMAVHDIKVDNAKVAEAFGKFQLESGPGLILCHTLDALTIKLSMITLLIYYAINALTCLSRSRCTSFLHCHQDVRFA